MSVVNVFEAKSNLSRLIDQVESGAEAEIIIARNGKPAARLVPLAAVTRTETRLGLLRGRYRSNSQEDFDAANEKIARLFGEDA
jgi:prevent-host-death family protein